MSSLTNKCVQVQRSFRCGSSIVYCQCYGIKLLFRLFARHVIHAVSSCPGTARHSDACPLLRIRGSRHLRLVAQGVARDTPSICYVAVSFCHVFLTSWLTTNHATVQRSLYFKRVARSLSCHPLEHTTQTCHVGHSILTILQITCNPYSYLSHRDRCLNSAAQFNESNRFGRLKLLEACLMLNAMRQLRRVYLHPSVAISPLMSLLSNATA